MTLWSPSATSRTDGVRSGTAKLISTSRTPGEPQSPVTHADSRVKIWVLWMVLHSAISAGGLLLSIWILAEHS